MHQIYGLLCVLLHALSGGENDCCADNEDAADNIEDGGADAAGAGQLCAGVVGYFNNECVVCINDDFNGILELVVAFGSFDLDEGILVKVNALDDDLAGFDGGEAVNCTCFVAVCNTVLGVAYLNELYYFTACVFKLEYCAFEGILRSICACLLHYF